MNFANYTDVIFRNTCVARSTLVGVSQEKLEEIFKTSSFVFDTALDLIDEKAVEYLLFLVWGGIKHK